MLLGAVFIAVGYLVSALVREAIAELSGRVLLVREICDLPRTENGIHVERKQFSMALVFSHIFNEATKASALATARKIIDTIPGLKDSHAIKVGSDSVEIGPEGAHKGIAIRDFMAVAPFKGRTPIYIGDGPTDEDAMKVVREMGGFNLAVGPLITNEALIDRRVDTIEQAWDVLRGWDSKLSLS